MSYNVVCSGLRSTQMFPYIALVVVAVAKLKRAIEPRAGAWS